MPANPQNMALLVSSKSPAKHSDISIAPNKMKNIPPIRIAVGLETPTAAP